MAKIITITIDPDTGDAEVELDGYQGKGCHAVQEAFTQAYGGESKKLVRKPEYNKPTTNKVNITR